MSRNKFNNEKTLDIIAQVIDGIDNRLKVVEDAIVRLENDVDDLYSKVDRK
jgi:hypothetical protein